MEGQNYHLGGKNHIPSAKTESNILDAHHDHAFDLFFLRQYVLVSPSCGNVLSAAIRSKVRMGGSNFSIPSFRANQLLISSNTDIKISLGRLVNKRLEF